jgi:KTSC domain
MAEDVVRNIGRWLDTAVDLLGLVSPVDEAADAALEAAVRAKGSSMGRFDYDAKAKTLTVTFAKGGSATVPCSRAQAAALVTSSSAGRYFNTHLRDRRAGNGPLAHQNARGRAITL